MRPAAFRVNIATNSFRRCISRHPRLISAAHNRLLVSNTRSSGLIDQDESGIMFGIEKANIPSPPIPANEENFLAGAKVYKDQCAQCHGLPDHPPPTIESIPDYRVVAAAEEEIAFAASLCDHPPQTLLAVQRSVENGEIRERFRTLKPRETAPGADRLHAHAPAFTFHEVEGDTEPAEEVDLLGMIRNDRRTDRT